MIGKTARNLTEAELLRLNRWQKRMLATFILAMSLIIVFVPLKLVLGLSRDVEYIVGLVYMVLVTAGAVLQFSEKCPSCGARIGFQSRLILPSHCPKCKTSLKR
jgi:hypothetical protein